jgi:uncharacterized membrane protein
MPQSYEAWIDTAGRVVDLAGVAVIVGGIVVVVIRTALRLIRRQRAVYGEFRQQLGRAILLGLELLVAADIIRTVAITPTVESVVVLGAIVLVRTFLSFSLEVEINGRWPWQEPRETRAPPTTDRAAL